MTRALSRIQTYPRHITLACSVAEYSVIKITFDCALSDPFDNLFLACFSASQVLCKGMIAVISASTVCCMKFLYTIAPLYVRVNSFVSAHLYFFNDTGMLFGFGVINDPIKSFQSGIDALSSWDHSIFRLQESGLCCIFLTFRNILYYGFVRQRLPVNCRLSIR